MIQALLVSIVAVLVAVVKVVVAVLLRTVSQTRMIVFLAAVVAVAVTLHTKICDIFNNHYS